MVKINRTYSIDQEFIDKLKEQGNASELINNLLEAHFSRANSKDLQQLRNQLDELENEIDIKRRERDRKADIIREVEAQANRDNLLINQEKERQEETKNLSRWLSEQVKAKEITFEDFRNIKALDNWEDCVNSVRSGDLDLNELMEEVSKQQKYLWQTLGLKQKLNSTEKADE